MIVQCPACRALVVADSVVVEGTRAGLRCTACAVITWLPTTSPSTAVLPLPAPPVLVVTSLPAVSTMPTAPTMPAAQVLPSVPTLPSTAMTPLAPTAVTAIVAGFDTDVVERIHAKVPVLVSPSPEQADLAARFSRLLSHWHNDAEHKQLLKAAALVNELPLVGARYRAVLDVVREDPRARAAQQELISLAMVTMTQTRTVTAERSGLGTGLKAAVGIVIVLVVGGGIVAGANWLKTSLAPLASAVE